MGVPGPGSAKGSALKGFDLETGEGKVSATLPGTRTLCNDIAVGPDKSVYVTNTFAPEILRLRPGSDKLEVWATDPGFEPPQKGGGLDGLAFGSDGNLYVDTFTKGELFRVEVTEGKAGKITKLQPSRPMALTDAVRLTEDGHAFLIIEGTGKLDRLTVDGDKASVETLKDGFVAYITRWYRRVGDGLLPYGALPALLTAGRPH
jgi:sugar lactone lactonase YvrE